MATTVDSSGIIHWWSVSLALFYLYLNPSAWLLPWARGRNANDDELAHGFLLHCAAHMANPKLGDADKTVLEDLGRLKSYLAGNSPDGTTRRGSMRHFPSDVHTYMTTELHHALQGQLLNPDVDTVGEAIESALEPFVGRVAYAEGGVTRRSLWPAEYLTETGADHFDIIFEKLYRAAGSGRDLAAHPPPCPRLTRALGGTPADVVPNRPSFKMSCEIPTEILFEMKNTSDGIQWGLWRCATVLQLLNHLISYAIYLVLTTSLPGQPVMYDAIIEPQTLLDNMVAAGVDVANRTCIRPGDLPPEGPGVFRGLDAVAAVKVCVLLAHEANTLAVLKNLGANEVYAPSAPGHWLALVSQRPWIMECIERNVPETIYAYFVNPSLDNMPEMARRAVGEWRARTPRLHSMVFANETTAVSYMSNLEGYKYMADWFYNWEIEFQIAQSDTDCFSMVVRGLRIVIRYYNMQEGQGRSVDVSLCVESVNGDRRSPMEPDYDIVAIMVNLPNGGGVVPLFIHKVDVVGLGLHMQTRFPVDPTTRPAAAGRGSGLDATDWIIDRSASPCYVLAQAAEIKAAAEAANSALFKELEDGNVEREALPGRHRALVLQALGREILWAPPAALPEDQKPTIRRGLSPQQRISPAVEAALAALGPPAGGHGLHLMTVDILIRGAAGMWHEHLKADGMAASVDWVVARRLDINAIVLTLCFKQHNPDIDACHYQLSGKKGVHWKPRELALLRRLDELLPSCGVVFADITNFDQTFKVAEAGGLAVDRGSFEGYMAAKAYVAGRVHLLEQVRTPKSVKKAAERQRAGAA